MHLAAVSEPPPPPPRILIPVEAEAERLREQERQRREDAKHRLLIKPSVGCLLCQHFTPKPIASLDCHGRCIVPSESG